MSLWSKHGASPTNLPFQDNAVDGTVYTDLVNNPEGREALGWVESAVPTIVSRMQLRVALSSMPSLKGGGRCLLDDINDFVGTQPRPIQEYWANVSEIHRDHQLITSLSATFGLSPAEVDNIFTRAKTVV